MQATTKSARKQEEEPTTKWCRKEMWTTFVYNSAIKCAETHGHGINAAQAKLIFIMCAIRAFVDEKHWCHIVAARSDFHSSHYARIWTSSECDGACRLNLWSGTHCIFNVYQNIVHMALLLFGMCNRLCYDTGCWAFFRCCCCFGCFRCGQMHSVNFYRQKHPIQNISWMANETRRFTSIKTESDSTKEHFSNSIKFFFFFSSLPK